ncbi:PABC domain-containing protein [Entamoeba marina]
MPYAGQQQPFSFPQFNKPKIGLKKPMKTKGNPKPTQPPKQEQKPAQPLKQEILKPVNDKELAIIIGDQIYEYVESLGKYEEDLIGRITGNIWDSFDLKELEDKLKHPDQELLPIVVEIAETLMEYGYD